MRKLFRIISYYLGKKELVFNDNMKIDLIPNSYIPDSILDKDVLLYNWGYIKSTGSYIVTARRRKDIENNAC